MESNSVGLVTAREWKEGVPENNHLIEALASEGIRADMVVWEEGTDSLSDYDAVIIRSCWDYQNRPDKFRRWLSRLETVNTSIWNTPEVLRWNMDKGYLRDLSEAGFPVIPSVFFEPGEMPDFEVVMNQRGWDQIIIKPRIGASGQQMLKVNRDNLAAHREAIQTTVETRGIFIQPYRESVRERGEWSFVFFNGDYQYAVHKLPGPTDFRAHDHRGGTYRQISPDPKWIDRVQQWVDRFPKDCFYQRMDGLIFDQRFELMEVEALEPSFYFEIVPEGAKRLARAIKQRLNS